MTAGARPAGPVHRADKAACLSTIHHRRPSTKGDAALTPPPHHTTTFQRRRRRASPACPRRWRPPPSQRPRQESRPARPLHPAGRRSGLAAASATRASPGCALRQRRGRRGLRRGPRPAAALGFPVPLAGSDAGWGGLFSGPVQSVSFLHLVYFLLLFAVDLLMAVF
jgi:hypothetical protein